MPVFIRFDGVDGDVQPAGASGGGVWKTTSFLTNDPVGRTAGVGALQNLSGNNSWAANALPVSRISLTPGGGGVEGRDPSAKFKVEQLINIARSHGPTGKLYVATDAGVYQNSRNFDGKGRLSLGTDQGVWRSGGASKMRVANNLKQMPLASLNRGTVEIIVTDGGGMVVGTHRLEGATVSSHPGGVNVAFCDGSVKF